MNTIQWKKVLIIVVSLNVLAWIGAFSLTQVALYWGEEAWFRLISYLLLASTLISSIAVSLAVKEKRAKHFFVTFACAIAMNWATHSIFYQWYGTKPSEKQVVQETTIINQTQQEEIKQLESGTVAIIEPGQYLGDSPVTVTVYSSEEFAKSEAGFGSVNISEIDGGTAKVIGTGELVRADSLSPDGKIVYQVKISFPKLDNVTHAVIGVSAISATSGKAIKAVHLVKIQTQKTKEIEKMLDGQLPSLDTKR